MGREDIRKAWEHEPREVKIIVAAVAERGNVPFDVLQKIWLITPDDDKAEKLVELHKILGGIESGELKPGEIIGTEESEEDVNCVQQAVFKNGISDQVKEQLRDAKKDN